jgi:hypothetical protein
VGTDALVRPRGVARPSGHSTSQNKKGVPVKHALLASVVHFYSNSCALAVSPASVAASAAT